MLTIQFPNNFSEDLGISLTCYCLATKNFEEFSNFSYKRLLELRANLVTDKNLITVKCSLTNDRMLLIEDI